jgi:phosphoglycerate dehydrogenase-like enzyme
MIDARSLATMKRGALLVNVGRDVWDPEPIPKGHPILAMPQAVITPHVASVSVRAVRALREGVAAAAARALKREPLVNIVNGVAATAAAKG